jgi:hypothetical protein
MSTTEIVIMVIGSVLALGGLIFATLIVRRTLKDEMSQLTKTVPLQENYETQSPLRESTHI